MRCAVFIIITFLLSSISIASEEIPVNVKAEKLKFIEGTGMIEASGSVEVNFKEITIYSDFLRMDPESNLATAEGNVKIVTRDYQAVSELIVYDASSEISTFSGFESQLSSGRIKGKLYLSAKDLKDLGEKMLGESGRLTTCDEEIPHYFATADKIEYYPEDKLIGCNVTLFVGELPVLWTPYLLYDLSKKRKRNWVFGHNEVEGDYVKSAWDYPYGILYLDLMEKKGFGHGTEMDYNLLGLGLGTFYLYHLDEEDTGITDWVTRIDHTKQINPWTTLKLKHAYSATYLIPSGRRDQTTFGLDLGYKHEARWNLRTNAYDDRIASLEKHSLQFDQAYQKISTDYHFNYDFSKRFPKWIRSSQRLHHRRPLWSDNVMLTTRTNYYHYIPTEGAIGDQRLEPLVEITGREPGFSWRYSENWYIDLDGDDYTADESYQYLEKLPEIEVTPNPVDARLFTLRPKFGYGYYHEVRYVPQLGRNRDYGTQRYQATLNADRRIPLAWGTAAILGAGLDQFLYTPGDQLYAYRESLSLHTNLGGFFRNEIDYRKGSTDGNTPFLFDRLGTRYHNVGERMTFYHQNKFRWLISGGHNWQTHRWFDVDTNLLIKPTEKLHWNLRTGWDIENTRYKDLVNSLTLAPYSFLSMQFSTVSDLNAGEIKSGSALCDIYFLQGEPNQWHLKFSQVYDPASDQFKMRDIMVIKDLHCWELKYTYSDLRKEFSLTFSLKALPDEPVGLSTGRGFYFDSFEKELKGLKKEGAIRRY
ncbi:MAG: hypothetical protein V3T21_06610 [Candidatus Margulisiibacteriota bacterium]